MKLLVLGEHQYGVPFQTAYPKADIDYVNTHQECVPLTVEAYAGIQFTGGADVTPALYGRPPEGARGTNDHRDMWEVRIFMDALRHDVPMLGICRGSQFLRVMCGGALLQEIKNHGCVGTHVARLSLTVRELLPYAFIPKFPNYTELNVTSTHHQSACPKTGEYLFDNFLMSPEGVIEGWKHVAGRVAAVQYHPEYMEPETDGFQLYQEVIRAVVK